MDGELSVGTPRDTLSSTTVTRDMSSPEVLQEHVSQMVCGQEAQLLAQVRVFLYVWARMISSMLFAMLFYMYVPCDLNFS